MLERHDVHVWRASLDAPDVLIQRLSPLLSSDERERANRFHRGIDRGRYIVGRGLLRLTLGRYLTEDPRNLRFAYGRFQKPALVPGRSALSRELQFNISHAGDLVLFAITRGRDIGVDVEKIRALQDLDLIARRFFSAEENAALYKLPATHRPDAFFRCWTRKEAFIKASGEGLSRPLDSFDVTIQGPAELLRVDNDDASRWALYDVHPAPEYIGAVAVTGRVSPSYYQISEAESSGGETASTAD